MARLSVQNEFALVSACCIWPRSERRSRTIITAAERPIDWALFLRVVEKHRVAGLVFDGIVSAGLAAPGSVLSALRERAERVTRRNLLFLGEAIALQTALDREGVPHFFIKGATLAQLAYGTIASKHSWDVDLVVTPESLQQALHVIAGLGYVGLRPFPLEDDLRYRHWLAYGREFIFRNERSGVRLELHWRLTDNDHLLPRHFSAPLLRDVFFSSRDSLRTLNDEDLFIYLCAHGAMHGWERIKWLADAAALVAHDTPEQLEARLRMARTANVDRCVAQTYLLFDRLFTMPAVGECAKVLRRNLHLRWLERVALNAMTRGNAATDTGSGTFDRLPLYLSHFLLGRGRRFLRKEMQIKLGSPDEFMQMAEDARPGAMMSLLRVVRWIGRGGRRRALKPQKWDCTD